MNLFYPLPQVYKKNVPPGVGAKIWIVQLWTYIFKRGNSSRPLLYIGYLNSLLRFYICHWQERGEGWHLQRNRERCLAAFMAGITVSAFPPSEQPGVFYHSSEEPAVDLRRLTIISVQSPRSTASPSKPCCAGMECASTLLQCAPLPRKPRRCSPSPFAPFPPPFPLLKYVLTFL